MSLTPVPPQRCTGCPHPPHAHACSECACAIATPAFADHHTTAAALARIEGMLSVLAGRVEYLIKHVLEAHEGARKVPGLETEVRALRERFEAHDRWERERAAGSNGGGV